MPLEFTYAVGGKRIAFIPKEKPTMNSHEQLNSNRVNFIPRPLHPSPPPSLVRHWKLPYYCQHNNTSLWHQSSKTYPLSGKSPLPCHHSSSVEPLNKTCLFQDWHTEQRRLCPHCSHLGRDRHWDTLVLEALLYWRQTSTSDILSGLILFWTQCFRTQHNKTPQV